MKIGIFDSGIGGITVLNHLKNQGYAHQFLYFGDTANVPYGSKSVQQIKALGSSAAERMKSKNLDVLILACNTASSLALEDMKEIMAPIPVLSVVEAGVQSILDAVNAIPKENSVSVLILGTRATIQSKTYSTLLKVHLPDALVLEQACPLLVPMIEEGWVNHPLLMETVREYVKPYHTQTSKEPSSATNIALLACTHYPWIRSAFEKALPEWKMIDSAEAVSQQMNLLSNLPSSTGPQSNAAVSWYFSDPEAVASFVDVRGSVERF